MSPVNGQTSMFMDGYHDWWNERWKVSWGCDGEQTHGAPKLLYDEIVKAIIGSHDVESVVDLGCGAMNQWHSAVGESFTGVDISENAIAHAQQKYPASKFIAGDITNPETWEKIPEADLFTCSEVLNHIEPEHYGPLVARIFHAAQKAVILRMWQREDLDGAGGYHWSNPIPDPEGWVVTDIFHCPNSTVGAMIYVYVRSDT